MTALRFELGAVETLQAQAGAELTERCAVGLVYPVVATSGGQQFVVRNLRPVPDAAYCVRDATRVSIKPSYCLELANLARREKAGVVFVHTHIGAHPLTQFSAIDDAGERDLATYFGHRIPDRKHFSALVTTSGLIARELGGREPVEARAVGRVVRLGASAAGSAEPRFDRQVRMFGAAGQAALRHMCVGIVGLGGTGSLVAQQLAHLGVGAFVLMDPDHIEDTNLNRVVGTRPGDVGELKVDVAARMILAINPDAVCQGYATDVVDEAAAAPLATVDFVFGCTDSMASRALINQFAYQNLIPCIDMGVAVGTQDGLVTYIAGRTQMLSPGLPCLVCTDKLDAEQVRREMLTPAQRAADPYIVGGGVEQPAVISLNATVTAAAVTMFLAAMTGIPSDARLLHYDGVRGTLRAAAMEPRPACIVCSPSGALGRGASWQLPSRRPTQ